MVEFGELTLKRIEYQGLLTTAAEFMPVVSLLYVSSDPQNYLIGATCATEDNPPL